MKKQQKTKVKTKAEIKTDISDEKTYTRDENYSESTSRIFSQMQQPQFEDDTPIPLEAAMEIPDLDEYDSMSDIPPVQALAEPVPLEAIPPVQSLAEPTPPSVLPKYGWITSLLNLDAIEQVARILANAKTIMWFTGAGISTESIKPTPGLPRITRNISLKMLQRKYYELLQGPDKDVFLQTYLYGSVLKILEAHMGASHKAIADIIQVLQKQRKKVHLITQNVDNLHELAASETGQDPNMVKHIHGWVKTATCPRCGKVHDYKDRISQMRGQDNIDLVLCSGKKGVGCNGVLSPDMVEYGEPVPKYDEYYKLAKKTDVIIVAGTSLTVTPANQLVDIVHRHGGKVIVFDLYSTQMQDITDIHIKAQLEYALPLLIWKLSEYVPIDSLGISDQIVTFKYWGEFFDTWYRIEQEHSALPIAEKINLFNSKFASEFKDPVWKIHNS